MQQASLLRARSREWQKINELSQPYLNWNFMICVTRSSLLLDGKQRMTQQTKGQRLLVPALILQYRPVLSGKMRKSFRKLIFIYTAPQIMSEYCLYLSHQIRSHKPRQTWLIRESCRWSRLLPQIQRLLLRGPLRLQSFSMAAKKLFFLRVCVEGAVSRSDIFWENKVWMEKN